MIVDNLNSPVKALSSGKAKASLGGPLGSGGAVNIDSTKCRVLLKASVKHLENIFRYIQLQQKSGRASLTSVVPDMEAGFQSLGGRWGDLTFPSTFALDLST